MKLNMYSVWYNYFYFIISIIGKHVRQLQARSIELGRYSITGNLVIIISNKIHILYWS
jgi:hypothetical protein